ncbi:MAG: hypothetical protein AAGD32_13845 [Planctomycetota bacterium]
MFRSTWGTWYGGAVEGLPPERRVVTIHTAVLPKSTEFIARLLTAQGASRIVELREFDDGFELDAADANFDYTGAEGFWMNPSAASTWMIYASHEASITFGGQWLIEEMRRSLSEFDRYIYKGWHAGLY